MEKKLLVLATCNPASAQSWSEKKNQFLPHRKHTVSAVQRKPANSAACKEIIDFCLSVGTQQRPSDVLCDVTTWCSHTKAIRKHERLFHLNYRQF
jgi:hypothetical protein